MDGSCTAVPSETNIGMIIGFRPVTAVATATACQMPCVRVGGMASRSGLCTSRCSELMIEEDDMVGSNNLDAYGC